MDIDTHESRMSYVSDTIFNGNRIYNGKLLVYFTGSRIDAQLYIQMKI